jgi:hypothetical protein
MNERTLRPANIAAAAVVLGGALIVVLPQHGMSIVRIVIVTIAAGAGLYALALTSPPAWWRSPFDQLREPARQRRPDELDWIRSRLGGRRQRIMSDAALPRETVRLLQPLIGAALEREGLDPGDRASRWLLSPLSRAVLTTDLEKRPHRLRMMRPDARSTAELVHAVLNDIDRIPIRARGTTPRIHTSPPRAT